MTSVVLKDSAVISDLSFKLRGNFMKNVRKSISQTEHIELREISNRFLPQRVFLLEHK